ncbi:hypothetical protein [Kordia jejudonensis]|uniref:hypothetical protein n=1 Tax=Kordia jejudonensis TaxID=1348245 RepID=UPI0012E040FD|nr:hypothetical protein [Kordia jejudonensis]
MKKKNLRILNLNKKTVSSLKLNKINGGTNGGTKTLGNVTTGFVESDKCGG